MAGGVWDSLWHNADERPATRYPAAGPSRAGDGGRAVAFFRVVAVDFDGTLTSGGQLSWEAVDAIDQVRRDGLVVVLVTGRIAVELTAEFPQIVGHRHFGIPVARCASSVTNTCHPRCPAARGPSTRRTTAVDTEGA